MDALRVVDIKTLLKSRGISCKGNKAELLRKLRNALDGDGQNVPQDSVSQTGSLVSAGSSISPSNASTKSRVERAANKAALEVRIKSMKDKQSLEKEIAELRYKTELLDLQTTLNELIAMDYVVEGCRDDAGNSMPASSPSLNPNEAHCSTHNDLAQRSTISAHLPPSHQTRRFHDHSTPQFSPPHLRTAPDLLIEREKTAGLMRLPLIEIKKFDGDITEFVQFIRSFELKIASKLDDDTERLYYLEQNVISGSKPHTIVSSCIYLEDGYQQAMSMLHKRYGQASSIAAAFLDKINGKRQISCEDGEQLDSFALLLLSCRNALGSSCHLMSDPRTLRNITTKLPYSLISRWRHRADDLEENFGRSAVFEDLVDFVMKEARVASNATFGQQMYRESQRPVPHQARANGPVQRQDRDTLVAATQAEESEWCLFCQDRDHRTAECKQLHRQTAEERKSFVMKNALCFGCLKKGHKSKFCRNRVSCEQCGQSHPTALHISLPQPRLQRDESRDQLPPANNGAHPNATSFHTTADCSYGSNALPVVPVIIKSQWGQCMTYAFLDSGSTHSFITESLMRKLSADHISNRQLKITTVDRDVSVPTQIAPGLVITDLQGTNKLQLPPLYTLPKIPVDADQFPKMSDIKRWEYLKDVILPEPRDADVGLLLGANAHLAMEPQRVIRSRNGGPFATLTRFGWIVSGMKNSSVGIPVVCRTKVTEVSDLEDKIKSFYNQEYEENLHSTKRGLSVEDRLWMERVSASITQEGDGHYSVALPLAASDVKLPDNMIMARKRLNKLKIRLDRNGKFAEDYKEYMHEMIKRGYAELVPSGKLEKNDGRVWFLPHHAVYHKHKPGKIRVVFDCAAQFQGVSLNDCLLQGPDQTNTLLNVLLRFRSEQIAFIADIEGMFNQVNVHESDRDFLRFLWWKDGNTAGEVQQYRMKVHIFGARSSPSIACYVLRQTAMDNNATFSEEAIETINENFYVDDVLKSTPDEQTAICLIHDLKELCSRGGFNLTKMSSNSQTVVDSIAPENKSNELKKWMNVDDQQPDEKALGIVWKTDQDILSISVNICDLKIRPLTRRGLLSAVGALYDPLGIVAPTILRGKQILQNLAKRQFCWDKRIPESAQDHWVSWLKDVQKMSQVSIPRSIKPPSSGDILSYEIHHFADASQTAYGTVSYVRIVTTEGHICCTFLMGKIHLAPLKTVTIPRLELMAAVTAVRISALISDAELRGPGSVTQEFFWTDSTTVLRYIANKQTRFHTFVANRLAIIHDGSTPGQWRYVPSAQNPADDASRGVQSSRWLHGPEFLRRPSEEWPEEPAALNHIPEEDPEVKRATVATTGVTDLSAAGGEILRDPVQRLIHHYSKKGRLLSAVAIILKLKKILQSQVKRSVKPCVKLTCADLDEAEIIIIRSVQAHAFAEEIARLKAGKNVRQSSSISKLDPFLKEDILRVGGRLQNSDLAYDTKHPIIVPSHGIFTDLLVQHAHETVGHSGRQHTLAELRKKFWILKGNSAARRTLKSCVPCKKLFQSTESQKMANLPPDRVASMDKVFTSTGIDYFGPFYVRYGRRQVKRYGVIFTCLSVRAVHIELAEDLSADSFICALKRFVSRRGYVKLLRSDRGTNFVGAKNELNAELENQKHRQDWISQKMLEMGIDWEMNVPAASHHGGAWERQIRTIRRLLDSMINQTMKEETLRTFLCEVEAIINSRPLTPFSSDPFDTEPLTPNHILLAGTGYDTIPTNVFDRSDNDLRKRWRQAGYFADQFWRRWRTEYVPLLQERPRHAASGQPNIGVGDIMLLVDESVPRGQWPLGKIVSVNPSADGIVRTVKMIVRGVTISRPVTKLVKICARA